MEPTQSSSYVPTATRPDAGYRRAGEDELWDSREEDPRAREELIRRYLPFAYRLAAKYQNRWETSDDLRQVASVGLMNAVNRFDPAKGKTFPAFASPTIQGELKRYFRDRVWMIRIPRDLQETILEVDHAIDQLGAELHHTPTTKEIDHRTNLGEGAALRASEAKANRVPASLDTPLEDGEPASEQCGREDSHFAAIEDSDAMRKAISDLGPDENRIMRLRFVEDMTQLEIAERVGCSQMHISRVLRRSVKSILSKISED